MTTMRPIRETLPLEEALALMPGRRRPDRAHRARPLREANGRVLAAATYRRRRRPAVRSRRDGRLRGHRRRHVRRRPLRAEDPAVHRQGLHGRGADRAHSRGECIEIATGAPMPEGADAVVMVEETEKAGRPRSAYSRRCIRVSTSAGAPPTSPPASRSCERGPAQPQPHRRARRDRRLRGRGLRSAPRRSPFDRQRDRRTRPRRSAPDRSTTSTASRCPRSSASTAALRCRILPPPTTSPTW